MMEPALASVSDPLDEGDGAREPGNWFWPGAALLLLLGAWLAFLYCTGIQLEDALITYRYAENLAEGAGLVFNSGERVLGTTTPLYALLLAAGGLLFGSAHIPLISHALGISAGLVAALATYGLMRAARVGPLWSAATILVVGLHPTLLWTTTGGMETPLVLCFMATSLLAVLRERWISAALLVALLALARPDGLLWAGLILLLIVLRTGRGALGPLLLFAIVLGAWILFATWYFGTPVPSSVTAKRVLELKTAEGRHWLAVVQTYGSWFLDNLWLPHAHGRTVVRQQVWGWIVFLLLGVLGIARRPARLHALILLPAMIVVFCLALWLGSSPRFPWYAAPLSWCSLILGMLGLWELWVLARLYWREFVLPEWVLRLASLLVVLVLALSLANRDLVAYRQQRDNQINEDKLRRVAGEWLAAHAPPDAAVATEAIGYQGYYSGRRIIDLAGLISPAVVDIMRCSDSHAAAFHGVLKQLAPDYIVLRSFEVRDNIHFQGGPLFETPEQAWYFRAHYAPAAELSAPLPDADFWKGLAELTIYARRSVPEAAADNSQAPAPPR
jgi:hypothetical protein